MDIYIFTYAYIKGFRLEGNLYKTKLFGEIFWSKQSFGDRRGIYMAFHLGFGYAHFTYTNTNT